MYIYRWRRIRTKHFVLFLFVIVLLGLRFNIFNDKKEPQSVKVPLQQRIAEHEADPKNYIKLNRVEADVDDVAEDDELRDLVERKKKQLERMKQRKRLEDAKTRKALRKKSLNFFKMVSSVMSSADEKFNTCVRCKEYNLNLPPTQESYECVKLNVIPK